MIQELLLIAVVITIVYFMFIKKKPNNIKDKKSSANRDDIQSQEMVQCCKCGIYCEIGDTIISNNRYFCSKECLKEL